MCWKAIASRSFTQLATLAPGVTVDANNTPVRVGGGGSTNIMMDGVSANDTGANRPLVQMSVESIAEVKVLTSGYQAEFGRNSGVQVTAVTKSGTNQFRGAVYDVERNSDWNANSKTNLLNGDPKTVLRERDWGFSFGGPIGTPGGRNKLFFFYAHEIEPRTAGADVRRYRVPTLAERAGDFSQSLDQNGTLYNLIKDPTSTAACSATSSAGCFQDGGVIGRIPAGRLYQPGVNMLNMYPVPTIANAQGLPYNYEVTRPLEKTVSYQPAVRVDYQPTAAMRGTFKVSGWTQRNNVFNGNIPGFDDSQQYKPVIVTYAATFNYTMTPRTFLEVTFGHAKNELTGCALGQSGTGPIFCQAGLAMDPVSNRDTAGLAALPVLFGANMFAVDPGFYSYKAFSSVAPPFFVNGQLRHSPILAWGSRVANAPPSTPYPTFLNVNSTYDLSASLSHVRGPHTLKAGYFQTYALKDQAPNGQANLFGNISFANDTASPIDTTFGFSNAAVGVINSYQQLSRFVEADMVAWNIEGYVQDNWKVNGKLTLDFGVRLVHQTPMYDTRLFASTFLPELWNAAAAPSLYVAGCSNGAVTCSGATRVAKNPSTGQLLGAGSAVAIGTIVRGSGDTLNGIRQAGNGIEKSVYTWPALGVAPRFGMAYDITGRQRMVLRGGAGLYFDRPAGNAVLNQVANPPTLQNITVRYAQLQSLDSNSLTIQGASTLQVFKHHLGLPTSTQWNMGLQMALPWASSVDISYVGQHAWNQIVGVNINAVDIGAAYAGTNQDPTLTSTVPGANALPTDLLRSIRGFGAITQQSDYGWNTFHSIQLSFQRRFSHGISFGFNDAIALRNITQQTQRLVHNADGSYRLRDDQAQANTLLQVDPIRHTLKGNFVWALPTLKRDGSVARAVGYAINDWQLSGVWTATSPQPYTVGFSYTGITSVNLTGSPDYAARVALTGTDPGTGCSSDTYRQFNTAAFAGPAANSVGLESSPNILKGCFRSAFDLAVARIVRVGKARQLQLRVDVFNALNQAIITGRNTTMSLASLAANTAPTNLPFDASGALIPSRSLPKNAGFGVANGYQDPRTVQLQVRFSF